MARSAQTRHAEPALSFSQQIQSLWSRRFVPEATLFLLAAIVFLGFLKSESVIAQNLGFSSDDAWIHFCFAKNLIEGHGFSYNPGIQVAGSTAPLWTLVCALFLAVFGDAVVAGKAAGFIGWLFVGWGIFHLVLLITKSRIAAFGAGALALLEQYVVWGALSGLEVTLYSALVIWAMVFQVRADQDRRVPYGIVSALLFLAGVTRPELLSLVPLFWLLHWWKCRGNGRKKEMVISLVTGVVILTPFFVFNFATIGRPFPLTFYAKTVDQGLLASMMTLDFGEMLRTITEVTPRHFLQNYRLQQFIAVPLMVGLWYLLFHVGRLKPRDRRPIFLLLTVPLYHLVVRALAVGGLYGAFARYYTFVFPLGIAISVVAWWVWKSGTVRQSGRFYKTACIVLAAGLFITILSIAPWGSLFKVLVVATLPWIKSMPQFVGHRLSSEIIDAAELISVFVGPFLATGLGAFWMLKRKKAMRLVALGLWGIWGLVVIVGLSPWASTCAWAVKNINDLNVRTAHWLDQNTPTDATIAVNDIGAIGYFTHGRRIIDLMGLVEPEILPYRAEGPDGIWRYLEEKRPDYLAVFDPWFPRLRQQTDVLEPVHSVTAMNYNLWGYHTKTIYRCYWDGRPGASGESGDK